MLEMVSFLVFILFEVGFGIWTIRNGMIPAKILIPGSEKVDKLDNFG